MIRKNIFISIILCIVAFTAGAQVKIGANPTIIHAGSVLELESTTQGLYLPRISLAGALTTWTLGGTAPSGTANGGMMVYNTNAAFGSGVGIYYWNGTQWTFLASSTSSNDWSLTGNSGTSAATNFIGTTDNVDWLVKTNNIERLRVKLSGNIVIGRDDSTGNPASDTLRAPNKIGTDKNGLHLTFAPGNGTGTGGSGAIVFTSAPVSTTGTTANTLQERARITNDGSLNVNTVANVFSDDLVCSQGSTKFKYPVNGYATSVSSIGLYGSNNSTGFGALGIQGNGPIGLLNGTLGTSITNSGGAFSGLSLGLFSESDPVNTTASGVAGVFGFGTTGAANGAYGVYGSYDYGYDNINYGIGVLGQGDGGSLPALNADYGVLGTVGSTLTAQAGVAGYTGTIAAPIANAAVYGSGGSSIGYGVLGINKSTGTGILGLGNNNTSFTAYSGAGGSFYSTSLGGFGAYNSTSFYGSGLFGIGAGGSTTLPSTTDAGVIGNVGTTGTIGVGGYYGTMAVPVATSGVYGASSSTNYGVFGYNSSTGIGVAGNAGTTANAGVAGYLGTVATPVAKSGIYGSTSSTTTFASYSNGALGINLGAGTLSAPITNAAVSIRDGHLQIGQGATTTTITRGATATTGTGGAPAATITNGTDVAGKISLTTGSGSISLTGVILTITFGKSYATSPIIVLTPTNSFAANAMSANRIFITANTGNFTVSNANTNLTTGTTYTWNYFVVETQ